MGEFVDKYHCRFTLQCTVDIEFFKPYIPVQENLYWNRRDSLYQCRSFRPGMRFDVTCSDIRFLFEQCMRFLKHRICFTDTGGISEKYCKFSTAGFPFCSDLPKKFVGIGSFIHLHSLPPVLRSGAISKIPVQCKVYFQNIYCRFSENAEEASACMFSDYRTDI